MSRYWNKRGAYQLESEKLQELVPGYGAAETLAGEMFRAASRIYYDAFNNGFGNNTSGAMNFLKTYLVPFSTEELKTSLMYIEQFTNCGECVGVSARTEEALDHMIDSVVEYTLQYPESKQTPSPCDMFDLQEPGYYPPMLDDDDEDYYNDDDY